MRPTWQVVKVALGLAIGIGYIYNIAVEGLPDSDASAVVKSGFYIGTAVGFLAAILLLLSGLRGRKRGE